MGSMKHVFGMILLIDVVTMVAPTRWLGPKIEFWIAAPLAAATGLLWLYERMLREDS
jgi:hypothetical protein